MTMNEGGDLTMPEGVCGSGRLEHAIYTCGDVAQGDYNMLYTRAGMWLRATTTCYIYVRGCGSGRLQHAIYTCGDVAQGDYNMLYTRAGMWLRV